MRVSFIPMLQCPVCGTGDLRSPHASVIIRIPDSGKSGEYIQDGILECVSCGAVFPVINRIATLLPASLMTAAEKEFLANYDRSRPVKTVDFTAPSPEARLEKIRSFLLQYEFYREETYPDEKSRAWIRNSVDYEVHHAVLKDKYIASLSHKLKKNPRSILDIGGGQGGTLSCFIRRFKPDCAFLIDMDDRFTPIAQLRDETVNVVRGDATRMPFKRKAFDLIISNGCLEHVFNWPAMLAEIKRTGTETYLSYIPNGSFPWEIGHLSAPLVPLLPKRMARRVCRAWHILLNNRQYTYELIDHLLAITNFVPSRSFAKECRKLKIDASNMFSWYSIEASKSTYHHTYGRYVRFLGRHPFLLKLFTGTAMALHLEPIVHYYLYHPE
jgi:uncharacterized protein YbaR (Trm112 family)